MARISGGSGPKLEWLGPRMVRTLRVCFELTARRETHLGVDFRTPVCDSMSSPFPFGPLSQLFRVINQNNAYIRANKNAQLFRSRISTMIP